MSVSITATLQRSSHDGHGDHTSEDPDVIGRRIAPDVQFVQQSYNAIGSMRNRDSFHLLSPTTTADGCTTSVVMDMYRHSNGVRSVQCGHIWMCVVRYIQWTDPAPIELPVTTCCMLTTL